MVKQDQQGFKNVEARAASARALNIFWLVLKKPFFYF